MDVKVVPVVVINSIEQTLPTMQALCDGNLPVAEITFRTACAEEAIRLAAKNFPRYVYRRRYGYQRRAM